MPGCKTCFDQFNAGTSNGVAKAYWVAEGTTVEQAKRGEGLFCDQHKPEGSVDIYLWMDEHPFD